MNTKQKVIEFAKKQGKFRVSDFVLSKKHSFSRQYISKIVNELVAEKKLLKSGSTASAIYALPSDIELLGDFTAMVLTNKGLAEHKVLEKVENQVPFLATLSDNVRSIFDYAFSEMLNNAIEHSKSKKIAVEVKKQHNTLYFEIRDFGVGVFINIMKKHKLNSETEAMQDLLKGKTTTAPQAHSGEGIFFTSKVADSFTLESFGYLLTIDNKIHDIFFGKSKRGSKKGTSVRFLISLDSNKHLINIFKQFQTNKEKMAFDKTEIQIKLYTMGTVHISRSQARRVSAGLDKFETIVLDFDKVPMIGQAFADEIFRVFRNKHPKKKIVAINMNEAVEFMIKRVSDK